MKSKASIAIGILIILGYFAMQAALLFITIPLEGALGTIITGSIKAIEGLVYIVVGYYFGSSEGSQKKDEFRFQVQESYQRNKDAETRWDNTFGDELPK